MPQNEIHGRVNNIPTGTLAATRDYQKWADKIERRCNTTEYQRPSGGQMQQSPTVTNEMVPSAFKKLTDRHPNMTTAAKVTVGTGLIVGATVTVLAPALTTGALSAVGFGGVVAAGSLAATIQGAVYGAATTGLFSYCQAMGAAAVMPSASSIAAAAGSVAAGTWILRSGGDDEGNKRKPTT